MYKEAKGLGPLSILPSNLFSKATPGYFDIKKTILAAKGFKG